MGSPKDSWIVRLGDPPALDVNVVGGKAASLTRMISGGIQVPAGFCLTVFAYEHFLVQSDLPHILQMELGRKPLDSMRWEEIWDAALRIRSAFLKTPLPSGLIQAAFEAERQLNTQHPLAVRSSAPGEDSAQRSFAGLHESIVNVQNEESMIRAVRTVWASLWSDAALLYRKELGLDPLKSRMAVIIQEMVPADTAGVAFGRDPRNQTVDQEIIEAVPGACSNLVDGLLEPDRWILRRSTGKIIEWQAGKRTDAQLDVPLLDEDDLQALHTRLGQVEALFGWPPDMEWAERGNTLSVLQARPITSGQSVVQSDTRQWYLTLRPKLPQLRRLAKKVSENLIPELERLGYRMAQQDIENFNDGDLADCIEERFQTLTDWRDIYKKDFIPLAHGVRYLGAYYNDILQPQDPYEFMLLLKGQEFLASHRNTALKKLAQQVQKSPLLTKILTESGINVSHTPSENWEALKQQIRNIEEGREFLANFERFLSDFMDTAYHGERLVDRPDSLFNLICQVGTIATNEPGQRNPRGNTNSMAVQQRLIDAVGIGRQDEAREVIAIGQLSWRLRDDDNILLGRVESQFLRALKLGAMRLRAAGRISGKNPDEQWAPLVVQTLRDPQGNSVHIDENTPVTIHSDVHNHETPRQLVGQPASPGLAEGTACVVNGIDAFRTFQRGHILVCESIQPTMTHLVLLASAVIEQRGGMLIHGAIIARELGIPCVNGISHATTLIAQGDHVTVDGYLGMVTLGTPDFDMEDYASEKRTV